MLLLLITTEEIKDSIFILGHHKTPRLDGFTAEFFQTFCPLLETKPSRQLRTSLSMVTSFIKPTLPTIMSLVPNKANFDGQSMTINISLLQYYLYMHCTHYCSLDIL